MNSKIILVGAGGHAKVCIELFRAMNESIAFCVSESEGPDHCLGVPVLKGSDHLSKLYAKGYTKLFVAIGANSTRYRLSIAAIKQGYQLVNAISPQAIISPTVKLGVGVAVMAGVVINADAMIDDVTIINTGATIDHDCCIGKAVHIAPQCALAGNVNVGDHSFLGIGCNVIPGIEIGENVTVGAGSAVIANIASNMKVAGIPAKFIT